MATYLFTFSRKLWGEEADSAIDEILERYEKGEEDNWSCGRTRKIQPGDRAFLMQVGCKDRGIFASGTVISSVYDRKHWMDDDKMACYVNLRFDRVLDPRKVLLPLSELRRISQKVNWTPQISGIEIPEDVAAKLEKRWTEFYRRFGKKVRKIARSRAAEKDDFQIPEEADINKEFIEGARQQIVVNRYERSSAARQACIKYHGLKCSVCGMSFEEVYGDIGRDYIHVHHLVPPSAIGKRYRLDPKEHLRPVCANCHAMIHRRDPPYTIDELKEIYKQHNT
ncbi:MAG: hypothetical protein KatS3mg112_0875 [Thermogutta sp.]|nr:MAG: hypothetical protein KatS3mg112_0875 [Thermogutta sp.]